jgi:hypothetical protein
MSAQGFCGVNKHVGKTSKLLLKDAGNGFSNSTDVTSVKDTVHGYEWTGKPKFKSSSRLIIRLTCKTGIRIKIDVDDGVESGDLTIVLTAGPPVDPVPVTYVDDDET